MKRRDLNAALLGAALGPLLPAAPALATARGERVQWPEIRLLDGRPFGAAQVRDRAVVLVFFSLSCSYCERHNVHVEKLHRAAAGRPLSVLGAVRERDPEAVRRHMGERGWTFPVTLDGAALGAALGARRSVPLTLTIDREGLLRESIPGEMFEDDVLGLIKLAAAG